MSKAIAIGILIVATVATGVAVNVVHFLGLPVGVVLYAAIGDAAIGALMVLAAYLMLWRGRIGVTPTEGLLAVLVGFMAAINYAVVVPAIIDRSLSVYILEKLVQRGGAIRRDAFARVFTDEYMPEHRLVDIRLTEQLQSGTITIDGGCVRITPRGAAIAQLTRAYRTNLLPKRRNINGALTDDLTDPFRNSTRDPDYKC